MLTNAFFCILYPYHALQYRLAVHQHVEAVLVVLVQIVNLRVHQIQSWLVHGDSAVIAKCEVPTHAEISDPLARLPCPEDAVVVSRPAVAGVLVLRREEGAVRPVVYRVNLPWCTQMPSSQSPAKFPCGHFVILIQLQCVMLYVVQSIVRNEDARILSIVHLISTTHLNGPANLSSVSQDVATLPLFATVPSVARNFRAFATMSVRLSSFFAQSVMARRRAHLQRVGVILLWRMSVSENDRFNTEEIKNFA